MTLRQSPKDSVFPILMYNVQIVMNKEIKIISQTYITLISVKATISYTEIIVKFCRIRDEGKLCTYSNTNQSLSGCEDSCKGYKNGSKMKQIFFLFL